MQPNSGLMGVAVHPDGRKAGATPARRITIVLHDLSGGGTECVAIRLANAWAAAGREVTLFCGSARGPLRRTVSPAVAVVEPARECRRGFGSRLRLAAALAGFARRSPQDVIFAPGNYHLPVLARFAALSRSDATIVCKISNPLRPPAGGALVRAIHRWGLRRLTAPVDCLVAMSPALREQARALLGTADIGLAWEPILPIRPEPRPAAQGRRRPLILAAGRLERQKNFELALEAFARVADRFDADLLILGEGRERAALQRRAAALGIADRVTMPGYRGSIVADLQRADLLLLTSHYEGYPAVVVEAIAAGTPVVATACSPAIPEILAGCATSEVTAADPQAIAAAIAAVLGRGLPAGAEASGLLLARHSVDHAASAYLDVVDAAHGRRRDGGDHNGLAG